MVVIYEIYNNRRRQASFQPGIPGLQIPFQRHEGQPDCGCPLRGFPGGNLWHKRRIRYPAHTNFTLTLEEFHTNIEEKIQSWFGLDFKFEIGIYSILNNDYLWYPCGTYLITASNTQYNSTSHTLSLTVSDWFAKLNGTRNGQIGGSPLIKIPVQDEDGNKSTLRDVLSVVVKQQGGIENYIIDEYRGILWYAVYNPDYEKYREDNPTGPSSL